MRSTSNRKKMSRAQKRTLKLQRADRHEKLQANVQTLVARRREKEGHRRDDTFECTCECECAHGCVCRRRVCLCRYRCICECICCRTESDEASDEASDENEAGDENERKKGEGGDAGVKPTVSQIEEANQEVKAAVVHPAIAEVEMGTVEPTFIAPASIRKAEDGQKMEAEDDQKMEAEDKKAAATIENEDEAVARAVAETEASQMAEAEELVPRAHENVLPCSHCAPSSTPPMMHAPTLEEWYSWKLV